MACAIKQMVAEEVGKLLDQGSECFPAVRNFKGILPQAQKAFLDLLIRQALFRAAERVKNGIVIKMLDLAHASYKPR